MILQDERWRARRISIIKLGPEGAAEAAPHVAEAAPHDAEAAPHDADPRDDAGADDEYDDEDALYRAAEAMLRDDTGLELEQDLEFILDDEAAWKEMETKLEQHEVMKAASVPAKKVNEMLSGDAVAEELLPTEAAIEAGLMAFHEVHGAGAADGANDEVADRDAIHVTVVLAKWLTQARQGASALASRAEALKKQSVGQGGQASAIWRMVETGPHVHLVHWAQERGMGRILKTTDDHHILFPTYSRTEYRVQDLRDCHIIHPAVGAKVEKEKQKNLTAISLVPSNVILLMSMYETALSYHSDDPDLHGVVSVGQTCDACRADVPAKTCALCKMSWHEDCCKSVLESATARTSTKALPPVLHGFELPEEFTSEGARSTPTCALCSAWVAGGTERKKKPRC